ncbi:MAG TPA: alpha/beta hydrolase [Rhizomicrobium sp.]|jgi:pimeloyl-ACP methyl ester carboxylesterase|nr:alpha/beta hydrolase [Rhizomicrobium sp.]
MNVPSYLQRGGGEEALVLLHGIGGRAEVWEPQLAAFADRYNVIAWNMPGYGGSTPLPQMTFAALADALATLLDTLDARRIHLVGHSMGGMVAQEFLRDRAPRLASVCLYATNPGIARPETPEAQEAACARADDFMRRRLGPIDAGKTMREMAVTLLDQLLAPNAPELARLAAIESVSAVPPDVYRDAMRCFLSFDGTRVLPDIRLPTLVIAGGEDRTMPPTVVQAMARQISGARFDVIPGVGHLANLEDPPAFNRVLRDFFAYVARAS